MRWSGRGYKIRYFGFDFSSKNYPDEIYEYRNLKNTKNVLLRSKEEFLLNEHSFIYYVTNTLRESILNVIYSTLISFYTGKMDYFYDEMKIFESDFLGKIVTDNKVAEKFREFQV